MLEKRILQIVNTSFNSLKRFINKIYKTMSHYKNKI